MSRINYSHLGMCYPWKQGAIMDEHLRNVDQLLKTVQTRLTTSRVSRAERHPLLVWKEMLSGATEQWHDTKHMLLGILGLIPVANSSSSIKEGVVAKVPARLNSITDNVLARQSWHRVAHYTLRHSDLLASDFCVNYVRTFSSATYGGPASVLNKLSVTRIYFPLKSIGAVYSIKPCIDNNSRDAIQSIDQKVDIAVEQVYKITQYLTYLITQLFAHSNFWSAEALILYATYYRDKPEKEKKFMHNIALQALNNGDVTYHNVYPLTIDNDKKHRNLGIFVLSDSNAVKNILLGSGVRNAYPNYYDLVAHPIHTEEKIYQDVPCPRPGMFLKKSIGRAYGAYKFQENEGHHVIEFPGQFNWTHMEWLHKLYLENPGAYVVPGEFMHTGELNEGRLYRYVKQVRPQVPYINKAYNGMYTYWGEYLDKILFNSIYGTLAANIALRKGAVGTGVDSLASPSSWDSEFLSELIDLPKLATFVGTGLYATTMERLYENNLRKQLSDKKYRHVLNKILEDGIAVDVSVGLDVIDVGVDGDAVAVVPYYAIAIEGYGVRIPLGLTVVSTKGVWV